MTNQQKISDILKRREYFDLHFPPIERCDARQDISYSLSNSCPICGYMTLETRCDHDICSFCFWQDDGQDNPDSDKDYIGPNSVSSITDFRIETYDMLTELKKCRGNEIQNKIGLELRILDNFISGNDIDKQYVMSQIELLSHLFDETRNISSTHKLNWKFLVDDKITEVNNAYNNTLPKAGLKWWQKLFRN